MPDKETLENQTSGAPAPDAPAPDAPAPDAPAPDAETKEHIVTDDEVRAGYARAAEVQEAITELEAELVRLKKVYLEVCADIPTQREATPEEIRASFQAGFRSDRFADPNAGGKVPMMRPRADIRGISGAGEG
jgi:hypothetical protein